MIDGKAARPGGPAALLLNPPQIHTVRLKLAGPLRLPHAEKPLDRMLLQRWPALCRGHRCRGEVSADRKNHGGSGGLDATCIAAGPDYPECRPAWRCRWPRKSYTVAKRGRV